MTRKNGPLGGLPGLLSRTVDSMPIYLITCLRTRVFTQGAVAILLIRQSYPVGHLGPPKTMLAGFKQSSISPDRVPTYLSIC